MRTRWDYSFFVQKPGLNLADVNFKHQDQCPNVYMAGLLKINERLFRTI